MLRSVVKQSGGICGVSPETTELLRKSLFTARGELNWLEQVDPVLPGAKWWGAQSRTTYFAPIGCRYSELGRSSRTVSRCGTAVRAMWTRLETVSPTVPGCVYNLLHLRPRTQRFRAGYCGRTARCIMPRTLTLTRRNTVFRRMHRPHGQFTVVVFHLNSFVCSPEMWLVKQKRSEAFRR